jgi:hypothetical protein
MPLGWHTNYSFFLSVKVPANNKIADDRRLRGPVLHDPVVIIEASEHRSVGTGEERQANDGGGVICGGTWRQGNAARTPAPLFCSALDNLISNLLI